MSESLVISNNAKWGFSFICLCLIILHAIFPDISIDTTTVGLLLLLLAPHILHLFKKIGLPGGGEIEMKDISTEVKELQEKEETQPITLELGEVTEVGSNVVTTSSVDHFYSVSDPSISVAAFRIDLERKLRELASLRGISDRSVIMMLNELERKGDFNEWTRWLVRELYSLSSRVVHGEPISVHDAAYLLEKGEVVIKYLESQIAMLKFRSQE